MKIKFWGTRGSIPTPISPAAIEDKIRQALSGAVGLDLSSEEAIERYLQRLPVTVRRTIGGNTACVEVRAGQQLIILDAGSGLRVLGFELMKAGERGTMLAKAFNSREGFTIKDDVLPKRLFDMKPDGPDSGKKVFKEKDFEDAIKLYYELIGCDPETGRPSRGKLISLGLEWVDELLETQNEVK